MKTNTINARGLETGLKLAKLGFTDFGINPFGTLYCSCDIDSSLGNLFITYVHADGTLAVSIGRKNKPVWKTFEHNENIFEMDLLQLALDMIKG